MKIYLLIETPILGELGKKTKIIEQKDCSDCGKLNITYPSLEYQFDYWNGQDLITAFNVYFISERLKNKMVEKEIKGVIFHKVYISKSDKFKVGKKAYQTVLPNFYHLEVTGKAEGKELWWKPIKVCNTCNNTKWRPTLTGINAQGGPSLTGTGKDVENPAPRNIYLDSWKKDDLFVQIPVKSTLIITQKFVDILNDLQVPINKKGGIWLRPTHWIDTEDKIIE